MCLTRVQQATFFFSFSGLPNATSPEPVDWTGLEEEKIRRFVHKWLITVTLGVLINYYPWNTNLDPDIVVEGGKGRFRAAFRGRSLLS